MVDSHMKFSCSNCSKEWTVPKEKLVYISDWPDTCPTCGSADIDHEKVMASSVVLENVKDKELEDIKLKNQRNASRRQEWRR